MSISRQNLTVVIVTLKSQHIIDQCIQSIDSDISILIVENSNNEYFKSYVENKYKNVSCILSKDNIGMPILSLDNIHETFLYLFST